MTTLLKEDDVKQLAADDLLGVQAAKTELTEEKTGIQTKIGELEARIAELDGLIQGLDIETKAKITDMEQRKRNLIGRRNSASEKANGLKSLMVLPDIAKLNLANDLRAQVESLVARAAVLEEEGKETKLTEEEAQERAGLDTRISKLSERLEKDEAARNAEKEILKHQTTLSGIAQEKNGLEKQISGLDEKISELGKLIDGLDASTKAKIEEAKRKRDALIEQRKQANEEVSKLDSQVVLADVSKINQAKDLRSQSEELLKQAAVLEQEGQGKELTEEMLKAKAALELRIQKIQEALKRNEERKTRSLKTSEQTERKNKLLEDISSLEGENASLEQQIKKLEEQIKGFGTISLTEEQRKANEEEIKRLTAELEKTKAERDTNQKRLDDLSQNRDKDTLEQRKKEIEAKIEQLKAEQSKGVVTDRLDLGAEAAKIGDAIFKTADIRRELADRQITREDFLAFYEQGKQIAEARLAQIAEENNKVQAEIQSIFVDKDSDKTLSDQLETAIKSNDEAKIIEVAKKLTANFIAIGAYTDKIEALGIKNGEITSIEDAKKIILFTNAYEKQAHDTMIALKRESDEQKENIGIFDREIKIIKDEIESLKTGKIDDIKAKSANEKALRAEQIRASMFGNEDLQAQWDDTFKRFNGHLADEVTTYMGKDGQLHEITYQTVQEYEGMEQDALFLNLEDYKFNLEQVSKYRASGGDILALDPKFREGKSEDEIKAQIEDMAEYVSSFHGLTNKHAVKYANLRTAGSTLKAMKPVKGDLPATQKMANAAENTLRFLGIRVPKFTKLDKDGNKVFNPKSLATLAVDAFVVGGVAAAGILGGPWGLAGVGVAYAARGAVVLGNKGAAAIEYARFGDEIDQNLPTPYEATKDSREVARKEYYREVEGMGKFTSWVKAKADRLPFFRKRAKETEEAIVEARIALSDATIDDRDEAAIKTVEENAKKADQNQQRREANYRTTARDAFTYNGIVVDPDSVDKDVAAAAIARNSAIRSNGGATLEDVNPASKAEKKTQYVKPDEELAKTDELDEVKTEGGSIASTAITVEQIYTGEQQRIDRWNKVWTAILTIAGNIGLNALRNGFLTEKTITTKEPDQVVNVEKEVPITEEVTRTELDSSQTISDIKYDAVGRNDVYGGAESATSQIADPDAVAFAIKHDGRTIELSLAEQGSSYTTRHVQELVSFDISKATPEQLFEHFRNTNGNFDKFVEALGLPPNATNAEIAKAALEQNTLYGQSGAMEGWRRMAEGGLKTVTEEVVIGTKTVIEQQIIPGNITQTVVSEFDPSLIIKAGIDGAVLGAAAGTIDQLHEANEQTKKTEPGTHEKLTPSLLISKIAQKRQDEINKQRQSKEQNENDNKDGTNKDDDLR